MLIHFCKLTGAGNDFIAIDNRSLKLSLSQEIIAQLCDRHFGIGADGLLVVEPALSTNAQFRMRYYNSDGGEAEMCGNGARCFALYAANLLPIVPNSLSFDTQAGLIHATFHDELIAINLSEPHSLELNAIECDLGPIHFLNTGVPHACVFLTNGNNLDELDLLTNGRQIRFHEKFAPAGTNANFIQIEKPSHIRIRTYERGVEDETLACGTGVTASAILYHLISGAKPPISVTVAGGDTLLVNFTPTQMLPKDVSLRGPADFIFEGTIEI